MFKVKRRISRVQSPASTPSSQPVEEHSSSTVQAQLNSRTECLETETIVESLKSNTLVRRIMGFIESHSLIVENKGSAGRDHMANERTFLAWMRTGFMLITVGVAFMQMYSIQTRASEAIYKGSTFDLGGHSSIDPLRKMGRPLGFLTAVFAIFVIFVGLFRYLTTQRALQLNRFPATRVMALLVVVFSIVVLGLILAVEIKSS